MHSRAEALAARIEEGAAVLASFAEGISDAEWMTPVSSGRDQRTIGVIVHHVASMYPIEIEVARAVASGGRRYFWMAEIGKVSDLLIYAKSHFLSAQLTMLPAVT